MTDQPTREQVLASIEPKSDQLNADDLIPGPITVTITGVRRGDQEQPIIVDLDGLRPYKPCKSMRRLMIAVFSDEPKKWVGHRMTLYNDPEVKWAGVKVGGIRISHMSGIGEPKTFLLTQTRGKKAEVTIFPIPAMTEEDQTYIDGARDDIEKATHEELKAIGFVLRQKSKTIQDALRPAYADRRAQLDTEADHGQASEADE